MHITQEFFYNMALGGIFAVAGVTAILLIFVSAPYGRHLRKGWGPSIPSTFGWVMMESVAVFTIAALFLLSQRRDPVSLVFLGMWELHYINRTFVFPFRRKGGSKPMPLTVVAMAVVFNIWNGYLNGTWLFSLGPARSSDWLLDLRFLAGVALFFTGLVINYQSDSILLRLRAGGDREYHIPRGGLFRVVSMPNYLGEVLEWAGWALATWSLAGLSFAVFTAANLVPRAVTNHRWYQNRFSSYPPERKAIFPFIL